MLDQTADEAAIRDKRAAIDSVLVAFEAAQAPRHAEWLQRQQQVPTRLYHYTTVVGLMGITSQTALWASDVRYMNDASELTYAADLIDAVVSEEIAKVQTKPFAEALPQRPGFANRFEYGVQPFIACFCEDDDLLSQWRAYGSGEASVSLGLDLSSLATFGDLPPNTILRKVIYDEEEQRTLVGDVVRTWLSSAESLIEQGQSTADLFPYPAIWALQGALAEYHLCFKHPTFREEQEWRLIKLVDVREELRLLDDRRREAMMAATRQRMLDMGIDMPAFPTPWSQARAEGLDIKFRASSVGLIPYVELRLEERAGVFTRRLPLWRVVQGPRSSPELSLASLGMYLESTGYGFHTEVQPSGIPLRY